MGFGRGGVSGRGGESAEEGGSNLAAASEPAAPSAQALPFSVPGAPLPAAWPWRAKPTHLEHPLPNGWRRGGQRLIINRRRLCSRPQTQPSGGVLSSQTWSRHQILAPEHGATGGPIFPAAHAAPAESASPSGPTRIPPRGGTAGGQLQCAPGLRRGKTKPPPAALGSLRRFGPPRPVWGTGDVWTRAPASVAGRLAGPPWRSRQAFASLVSCRRALGCWHWSVRLCAGWSRCSRKSPPSRLLGPQRSPAFPQSFPGVLRRACLTFLPKDPRSAAPSFQFHSTAQAPLPAAAAAAAAGSP